MGYRCVAKQHRCFDTGAISLFGASMVFWCQWQMRTLIVSNIHYGVCQDQDLSVCHVCVMRSIVEELLCTAGGGLQELDLEE